MDLLSYANLKHTSEYGPLAERLRPATAEQLVGLPQNSGPWRAIWRALKGEAINTNFILWGPPGTGKTSLARVLATAVDAEFVMANAICIGSKELKQIGEDARNRRQYDGRNTVLFLDEIHRLNKAQQDVLLPYTEKGQFVLIGATTENPSYELNAALLSRCQVVRFERLTSESMQSLLLRAAETENVVLNSVLTPAGQDLLIAGSDGDARRLLNLFELLLSEFRSSAGPRDAFTAEDSRVLIDRPVMGYDKAGDEHYDCISAFIKSVRGSDPDAAIYYLARMLESGEDPVFVARRLVILASEDIGNADPRGLSVAAAGLQAVELVGMPEARITLAQVTTYLASAPKSNAAYMALLAAEEAFKKTGRLSVPLALRSSKTKLAKSMDYGKGYKYSHDGPRGYQAQDFLPEELRGTKFYEPKDLGFEKNIRQYLDWLHSTDVKKE